MIVQLLGYAPDIDPTTPGVLVACTGVVPTLRGFRGAPSPITAQLATLNATCQGAATLFKNDLSTRVFAGTPGDLFEAGTSTWATVTQASGQYSTGETARWRFAQQGNVSLAVNGANTVQFSSSSGAFSKVGGAPVANTIETVGAFVFAANTSGGSNIVQWAGINSYTSWAASVTTQAGNDTLTATPGPITAIKAFGSTLVVYKKNSMYLGINVGPPNIWQINAGRIVGTAGAMSQESVVSVGTPENPKHIFMGSDDFYMYDGSRPLPIGDARTKKTVFGSLLQSRYYTCAALHDQVNSLVYFWYPVADSVYPDHCVVYNYRTNKWGVDDRQIQIPFQFIPGAITYAGVGSIYSTYGVLPNASYGDAFLNSAVSQPAIFNTANTLQTLTGAAGNTSFTTGDMGSDSALYTVSRVRPRFFIAPTSASWTPMHRMNTGDALTVESSVALSSLGSFDFIYEARWHRGQMSCVGDWEMAGFSAEAMESALE